MTEEETIKTSEIGDYLEKKNLYVVEYQVLAVLGRATMLLAELGYLWDKQLEDFAKNETESNILFRK